VQLTVEKIESAPDGMRFHLVVENTTTSELTLPWDTFDLTDDTGHQYAPVLPSPAWANDLSPGTYHGIIDVGQPLQPAAKVLEAGWVRALGTYEVGSLYATVRLSPGSLK